MLRWLHYLWCISLRRLWPVYLIVLLVYASGITVGWLGVDMMRLDERNLLRMEAYGFLRQVGSLEFDVVTAARDAVYNGVVLAAVIYFLGMTIIGIPLVLVVLFVRGFALGFAVEFLTGDKGLSDIMPVLAAILPHHFLSVPALLVGVAGALSFAWLLLKRFQNSHVPVWPAFAAYNAVMVLVGACFIAAGLVEVYVTPALIRFVSGHMF